MNVAAKLGLVLLAGTITLATIGCGGDEGKRDYALREITGTVTLDGKPLPNATVSFQVQRDTQNPKGGRTAFGKTDAEGKYAIEYIRKEMGAPVGMNLVSISTAFAATEASEGVEAKPAVKEIVPAKYNTKNKNNKEMMIKVEKGSDPLVQNFDLKSK